MTDPSFTQKEQPPDELQDVPEQVDEMLQALTGSAAAARLKIEKGDVDGALNELADARQFSVEAEERLNDAVEER